MICEQKCTNRTSCTCPCDRLVQQEVCEECIDQQSIDFSGICDASQFELNDTWQQFDLIGSIMVPMEKPSIEEVDSINTNVEILSRKVIQTPTSDGANNEGRIVTGRKLIVEGLLCISISYVALVPEQSVNSFHGAIPFSAFIVLPADTELNDVYDISACISSLAVKRVCERRVELASCIFIKATKIGTSTCTGNFIDDNGLECSTNVGISGCKDGNCFTKGPRIKGECSPEEVEDLLEAEDSEWTEISIPEVLTIPEQKPDVKQLLTLNSRIDILCQEVIKTPLSRGNLNGEVVTGRKLLVHGLLRQRITYASTNSCSSVHSAHFDVPICAYIVLPADTEFTTKYKITTCIEDIYACALNERQIFKNTTLFIKAESFDL